MPSPLKRNISLQPLSREHHNILIAILLVKKGIRKKAAPGIMANFIGEVFTLTLHHHFRKEEQILFPIMEKHEALKEMITTIKQEHEKLTEWNHQLDIAAEEETVKNLINLMEQHIRFEERKVFPAIEQNCTKEELEAIGKQWGAEEEKTCINYPIRFWE